MQRTQRAHRNANVSAAAATVAPLLQLKRAARKANTLARLARAQELYERALAAAELAQPHDSLVIAALLEELCMTHQLAKQANVSSRAGAACTEVMLRLLHLLHKRWQAGTLFAPTAEEVAYLVEDEYPYNCICLRRCAARSFSSARQVTLWRCIEFLRCAHLQRRRRACAPCMVRCVRRSRRTRAACCIDTRAQGKRGQPWRRRLFLRFSHERRAAL
jgi:hypothetical protein